MEKSAAKKYSQKAIENIEKVKKSLEESGMSEILEDFNEFVDQLRELKKLHVKEFGN